MKKLLKIKEKTQTTMCFNNQGQGRTFYLRFYEAEHEKEMQLIKRYYDERPERGVSISKRNGTYRVYAQGPYDENIIGPWEILMHKYCALSNLILIDGDDGKTSTIVTISKEFIED